MSKKMPFKDPVKDHTPEKTENFNKLWNFDSTPYDQRHSCFISAGMNHGVGHRQPEGHKGNATKGNKTIPLGVKRFEDY